MSGGTEETHERLSQHSLPPGRDLNSGLPEQEAGVPPHSSAFFDHVLRYSCGSADVINLWDAISIRRIRPTCCPCCVFIKYSVGYCYLLESCGVVENNLKQLLCMQTYCDSTLLY
jgi:hypothetical protein